MGAGLSDQVREEMTDFIISIRPDLPVHLTERTCQSSPVKMIPFVNEQKKVFYRLFLDLKMPRLKKKEY